MNSPIDIRTGTLFNATVGLMFWLYMTYVFRTRKTYPGFRQWTIASLFVFTSMVLIALRDAIPDWASVVAGNTLSLAALALVDRGIALFMGRTASRWWVVVPVAGCLGVSVYFTYWHPDIQARIVVISLLTILALVHCLVVARPSATQSPRLSTGWLMCSLGGLALWSLVRTILTWLYEGATNDFLSASVIQGLSLVIYSAGLTAIFLGLLILHHQRIEADLRQAIEEVHSLRGIIPICSKCKKIRDDLGAWNQLEEYISRHSDAEFSHGYCPECFHQVMTDLK